MSKYMYVVSFKNSFFFDLYCCDSTCCDSVSKFDEVRVNMLWRVGVDRNNAHTKRLFTQQNVDFQNVDENTRQFCKL